MAQGKPARSGGVTLRDVAKAAGVSIWTASNTFSNPGRVADVTRERVLAAAGALDYQGPHAGARSLALGRTGLIAFVAPTEAEALLGDAAAALVARGLLTGCDRAGLSLVLAGRTGEGMVDGRVVFRAAGTGLRGPAVLVDGQPCEDVPAVTADVRGAGAALAALLFSLGHHRLAVLSWPGGRERLAGVADGWPGPTPLAVYAARAPGLDDGGPPSAAGGAPGPPRPTEKRAPAPL